MARRINPESGVIEKEGFLGLVWEPVTNENNNRERVNPETGVIEEEGWLGLFWTPKEPNK